MQQDATGTGHSVLEFSDSECWLGLAFMHPYVRREAGQIITGSDRAPGKWRVRRRHAHPGCRSNFAPLTWESRICFWFSPCLMNNPHLSIFLASNSLWEGATKKFTARFSTFLSWEDTASTHTPADGLGWNRKLAETQFKQFQKQRLIGDI